MDISMYFSETKLRITTDFPKRIYYCTSKVYLWVAYSQIMNLNIFVSATENTAATEGLAQAFIPSSQINTWVYIIVYLKHG